MRKQDIAADNEKIHLRRLRRDILLLTISLSYCNYIITTPLVILAFFVMYSHSIFT